MDVDQMDVINLGELLDEDDNIENDQVVLPLHKRCGNNSLNLVVSVDSNNARGDKTFQRAYDKAMGKVQALCNAVSKNTSPNDSGRNKRYNVFEACQHTLVF